jgi:NAD(P)-dependent dehydrogenase (short-subunit alcohol dehydrogenase family)
MNPVALVTGGSSGIGAASAIALADAGCDVHITYRHGDQRAAEVVGRIRARGRTSERHRLDLSARPQQFSAQCSALLDRLPDLVILVNNAAVNHRSPALQSSTVWDEVLRTDLSAPVELMRQYSARMVQHRRQASIVNVTSILDSVPLDGCVAYCAAKAGLEMASRVFALELAPHGIRVNTVAPGHVQTAMTQAMNPRGDPEIERQRDDAIPIGRVGQPEDIAAAVVFLACRSPYATGSRMMVDGGLGLLSGPRILESALARLEHPS